MKQWISQDKFLSQFESPCTITVHTCQLYPIDSTPFARPTGSPPSGRAQSLRCKHIESYGAIHGIHATKLGIRCRQMFRTNQQHWHQGCTTRFSSTGPLKCLLAALDYYTWYHHPNRRFFKPPRCRLNGTRWFFSTDGTPGYISWGTGR